MRLVLLLAPAVIVKNRTQSGKSPACGLVARRSCWGARIGSTQQLVLSQKLSAFCGYWAYSD